MDILTYIAHYREACGLVTLIGFLILVAHHVREQGKVERIINEES